MKLMTHIASSIMKFSIAFSAVCLAVAPVIATDSTDTNRDGVVAVHSDGIAAIAGEIPPGSPFLEIMSLPFETSLKYLEEAQKKCNEARNATRKLLRLQVQMQYALFEPSSIDEVTSDPIERRFWHSQNLIQQTKDLLAKANLSKEEAAVKNPPPPMDSKTAPGQQPST